ncbi:MAG: class I SAM-dependent methyltransferase [Sporichthyaceae bacterium]
MPMHTESVQSDADLVARRLRAHERIYDPGTIRRLEALGVGPGWRCLEVGAGGGSIARWLCSRVGAGGRVRAIDVDTRFVSDIRAVNLDVSRLDVAVDDVPAGPYDLIHVRAVLIGLTERREVLAKLVAALAPRGWLLVEEPDGAAICAVGSGLHREVLARIAGGAVGGTSADWARDLPEALHDHGLRDIGAESQTPILEGGSPSTEFLRLTAALLASGTDPDRLDEWSASLDAPAHWFPSLTLMAAWGRRREG